MNIFVEEGGWRGKRASIGIIKDSGFGFDRVIVQDVAGARLTKP
jgi:hypothetical protein